MPCKQSAEGAAVCHILSDKVDLARNVSMIKDIIIKRSIHKEDITIINVYVLNVVSNMWKKLQELETNI